MMRKNDAAISKSLEQLSAGLRINHAADNAAGLLISEQLRAQLGGLQQAQENTSQAIAMVQTAEGALDEMNALLSKAKKLALSSMSDATTDSTQAAANQTEFANIVASIQRIGDQTQYAGSKLLDGSLSDGKTVQLGAFTGQNATISIVDMGTDQIGAMSSNGAVITAISSVSITSAADATTALSAIEGAINVVSTRRGNLGAIQSNSLETTLNSLRTSYENLKAAESTLRDVYYAEESATFTRNTILVQSATAMLAQANQLPQNVLKLLG
jgi:flagellin